MAVDITFEGAPASGSFATYSEDGFQFTTVLGDSPIFNDVLWNGLQRVDEGSGSYLINQYSQDTVVLKYTGTKTFGAVSLDLDGYRNGAGNVPTTAAVTFNFVGQKADNSIVHYSFTTDSSVGWQHITLTSEFATGLTSLSWTTNAPVEAWGAFDNAVLVVDATDAPATGVTVLKAAPDAALVTVKSSTLINVTVNDIDPDGSLGIAGFGPDASRIALGSFSGKSALGADIRFESGQILYTANATSYANLAVGKNAIDTFHYAVVDGTGATSTSVVTVKIVNPGSAPILTADTASVNNDQSVTVDVLRNDRDNDPGDILTLSGFGPNSGAAGAYQTTGLSALGSSVSIVGGKLVYNADATVFDSMAPGATRVDTVYYTVTDSNGASSVSTLTVTVAAPVLNRPPVAVADTAAVLNDQTVTINVLANDRDPDGDVLRLSGFGSTAATANGSQTTGVSALGSSVSLVSGKLVYNANAAVFDTLGVGQTKVDTVYYTVTDSKGASSVATASVTVTNPNHAPTAVADTAAVVNEKSITLNVLANDTDPDVGDVLKVSGFGSTLATANGSQGTGSSALGATVTLQNGQLVYKANANVFDSLSGSQTKVDTVYYTVTDANGLSSKAAVSITVSAATPSAPNPPSATIEGTRRDDTLVGTSKNDVINGLAGDDRITGGAGNDTLIGGDGDDTFIFGANFGKDVILDFNGGHWERSDDCYDYDYGYGFVGNVLNFIFSYVLGFDGRGSGGQGDQQWVAGDVIRMSTSEFRNYNDLVSHGVNTSNGVLFTTDDGKDSLLLQGVTLNSLESKDFLFV